MQLSDLTPMKNKLMWMLKVFNTFHKKQHKQTIHEVLELTENPLIKELHRITTKITDNTADYLRHGKGHRLSEKDRDRYRDRIRYPVEFGMVIPLIDSAFQDPFIWGAHEFGKKCREDPEFWQWLEDNKKPPELWYFNCWEDFKAETEEKQETGEIAPYEKSEGESMMVDNMNDYRVKEFAEKSKKHNEKHSHW